MKFKQLSLITATLLLSNTAFAEEATLAPIDVISTNKTEQSINDTTSDITVITSEEIEEKGYQTVAQAISSVAGIQVDNLGGLGQPTSFFVRGQDSGKVLVLLDGMRLNDPSTTNGTALLDSLTTNNIQQIEIVKGGVSSIWGSNASAGVINIITKEPKEGIHGMLGLSYGSYNTRGADADLSYKSDKLTAQMLAGYLKTDGFSALAPRDAEADGYENKNANLKFGYAFNQNNKVNFSYNRIRTKTDYDDMYSIEQANDDYSHATADQTNYAVDYRFKRNNYSATLTASKGEFERDYYTSGSFGYSHNTYRATLREYALINAYNYTNGKAVLGLEYKDIEGYNHYISSFPSLPTESTYTDKGVFLSNLYNINENTLLETNLRYDSYDEFDNKTTYKIGLKHHHDFLKGFTTSANYYTSYDAPSAYQLATPTPGSLLKPSYTKGFDISAAYKKLISVSYFNNRVEDNIDYVYDPLTYIGGYQNVEGTSKFEGLEVQGAYTLPTFNLHLSGNYTHLFKFEKEDGTDLPRRAKDTLNATLEYFTENNMHFGINAQYIGDRLDTDGSYPIASDVETGNYTLWNLNFNMELMKDLELYLNARNIFDKEYQSVYGYATEGRSLYAKVKYSF
ncbi:TonB-dependent receptor plug domain-containing protein [Sulfurovum sp. NBC37-1]|uniref:TonB-dependent receptor plug domain-containing protein n=1 Tax=Sulfurovum sp. (strain NBC37-1) TaxID=387093 RepID=UPI0001587C3D|nr:TonB-dependent receptor [Sulfurovum sp. NBC37-1]BAF72539.1 TonB-dependent receptor [Sulfurovum sp. NBC37-1]